MGKNQGKSRSENSAARRIGYRIRRIREAKGMTQKELGELIGLNGDRVQKYENGALKPKEEMCKKIANALEVSPRALQDLDITDSAGVMHMLFELERLYGLKPKSINDEIVLSTGKETPEDLKEYFEAWAEERQSLNEDIKDVHEGFFREARLAVYDMWKANFPVSIDEK